MLRRTEVPGQAYEDLTGMYQRCAEGIEGF